VQDSYTEQAATVRGAKNRSELFIWGGSDEGGHSEEGRKSNGNGWKCAGGGVLLGGLQRCFHSRSFPARSAQIVHATAGTM